MKLAVVMDPIEEIKPEKDGTLDLNQAAQQLEVLHTTAAANTTIAEADLG